MLLSIVVPTKDRYEYLEYLVKIINDYKGNDIELIIQDNSSGHTKKFINKLHELKNNTIKYIHSEQKLSVVENCERAVSAATGEYVCMIGDDDAIVPEICIDVIKYAKKNDIDCILFNKASYYWPDTSHAVWGTKLTGNLFLDKYTYNIKKISVYDELTSVLKHGAATTLMNMPRLYHGIVSKDTLHKLKNITGAYFPGPSPDMANAIGLCAVSSNVIFYDAPGVISGHGKKSTGGLGGAKKHHGEIESQSHLPDYTGKEWSKLIPKFWSGPTIYAESASKALSSINLSLNYQINYGYLYAYCLVFESRYNKLTYKLLLKNRIYTIPTLFYVIQILYTRIFNYGKNILKFNFKTVLKITAMNSYDAYLVVKNQNLNSSDRLKMF